MFIAEAPAPAVFDIQEPLINNKPEAP